MSDAAVLTAAVEKEKMNKGSAVFYSVGFMGSQVCWYMVNSYLMLFYTDVVGLAAGAISMIMLIARIWDAVNDPMMGVIVDRTTSRWGKFRPYLVVAPPFLAIFNILTFTVFPLEGNARTVVCLLTYILVGMAYTVVQVAINGLVNRLSKSSQVKMDIIAMSQVASTIMQTVLAACVMPVILYFSHGEAADGNGYFWATVIFSLMSVPMFWLCAARCREVVAAEAKRPGSKGTKKPLLDSLQALVKNRMLLITIFSVFVGAISAIARMSMLSYYVIYVAGAYTLIAPVYTVISLSQMIGNVFLPAATKRFGKKRWFASVMLVQAASLIALYLVPDAGTGMLIGLSIVYGFANSATSICYGMLCDSIEYGNYMYGVRDEALSFSFMSLAVKAATALTGSVGILLLAGTGYVAGAEQTEAAKNGINFVVNLLPAILVILSLIPLFWYKLNDPMMEKIAAELELRNSGNN